MSILVSSAGVISLLLPVCPMSVMAILRVYSGPLASVISAAKAVFDLEEAAFSGDFDCADESFRFFILFALFVEMRAEFCAMANPRL
mmetsp:Transcript_22821/g.28280  ORF Transcript_22821/g.28280 Transcript_22821/m.28280 type:complete len:87 (-) Transcript_22821:3773-4033(-)